MSKEITKAFILQQLQDKFKLRELEPEIFRFSEQVIPVYDIEQHLMTWEVVESTVSITSAASFVFFTVPDNERWTVRAYMLVFGMTGAHKATGVYICYRPGNTDCIYLDLKKGQEVTYLVNLPVPAVLQPNNRVNVVFDTYVSTQDLTLRMDVLKEEIR